MGYCPHVTTAAPDPHLQPTGHEHDRAVLIALCVAAFTAALNFFATSPFYPEIADDLATSVPLLGQVTTLMILISAVLGLMVGPLADRYGFRRLLALGVAAVSLTLIGIGLSPSIPFVFVFSVTGGLADALVFGLAFAVAGTWFHGEARVRAIGWTAGSLSIAPVVGVPVLTFIGDLTTWRVALAAGGLSAAIAAAYVWFSLPETHGGIGGRLRIGDLIDAYRPVLRDRPVKAIYLINFLRGITWLGMTTYMGAFLEDRIGLATREIGLVYMLSGLGYAVGGFSQRPRLPGSLISIAGVSSLAGAVAVAAIVLGERLWILLPILPVASFLSARGSIAITTQLAGMGREGPGTIMVLNGSAFNLAAAAGALIGGVMIGLGGYPLLGAVLPLFSLAAAWVAFRASRRPDFA